MLTTTPRILIVDDKPENLLALETILNDLQVEVVRADSGKEALALMLRYQFAVVLLDVKMPEMGGIETATLMQGHDSTMHTPVIFVTGYDMNERDQLEGYAVGAADYIIKPVNPDILKSKVNLFLLLFIKSAELKIKIEETATLEQILKEKNTELEEYNASLECINLDRQQQYDQTRLLLNMNPDGMLVIDNDNIILYTNPAAAKVLNREKEELEGEGFNYTLSNGNNTEIIIGEENFVEMSGVPIDWNGKRVSLVTLHDVTERKRTEARLLQLAKFDQLTGLANRGHCLEYTIKALARAKRRNGYIAVLFLDLDKFKDINDSLGHEAGDHLLVSVAERLNICIREGDMAARIGGDEFALILDEISQPEDAAVIAKKIIDAMLTPHILSDRPVVVGCSVGIATSPLCGDEPEALFKSADLAMYNAKSKGRNNYQFFSKKMQQRLTDRLSIEQDLLSAVNRNEFLLHYQPQVNASSGTIVGMETLLRWQHGKKGMISPGQFIPIMEGNGSIIDIGEWVLSTACRQAKAWEENISKTNKQPLTVAINVSIKQLTNGDFRQRLYRVLKDTGVDPGCIELELTESMMMVDADTTVAELEAIHREGLNISMDDFGTGYSSLSYLQRLPLNTLKIDLSFIAEIGKGIRSEMIIKTIIAMAHNLGLRVVAEGVETEQQVAFLRANKCDLMQGYYFSRPLPMEQATLLLQQGLVQYFQSA